MASNINELLFALEKIDPAKYRELKAKYASKGDLFAEGVELGDGEPESEEIVLMKADACIVATDAIIEKCDSELIQVRKRIQFQKRLTLFSQIATTIGSAAVVATLLKDKSAAAIIPGSLTFVSSLIPPVNEYLFTGPTNRKITDSYGELLANEANLNRISSDLKIQMKLRQPDIKKLEELTNSGNKEAAEANKNLQLL